MKKSLVTLFMQLFVVVMLCGASAQAQTNRVKPAAPPVAQPSRPATLQTSLVEEGTITGSVYRNTYFGMQLTIPPSWDVVSNATKKEMKERSKDLIVMPTEREKAQLDASVARTTNLLTVSKLPLGATGQFNASVLVAAEAVPLATTGALYMSQLKRSLQFAQVPVTFEEEGRTQTINGTQFHTLTILIGPPESVARQTYYVVLKKGYALGFITTIISESDADVVNSVVKSVKFQ
ncbi:MAG: hypothetical protein QOF02_204 [Blastocatellia bacterium]|jgi:hypothetical protein|nr:hypothetical protein [Blastocatellia bacterium]